jgi:hypothetical protein
MKRNRPKPNQPSADHAAIAQNAANVLKAEANDATVADAEKVTETAMNLATSRHQPKPNRRNSVNPSNLVRHAQLRKALRNAMPRRRLLRIPEISLRRKTMLLLLCWSKPEQLAHHVKVRVVVVAVAAAASVNTAKMWRKALQHCRFMTYLLRSRRQPLCLSHPLSLHSRPLFSQATRFK